MLGREAAAAQGRHRALAAEQEAGGLVLAGQVGVGVEEQPGLLLARGEGARDGMRGYILEGLLGRLRLGLGCLLLLHRGPPLNGGELGLSLEHGLGLWDRGLQRVEESHLLLLLGLRW